MMSKNNILSEDIDNPDDTAKFLKASLISASSKLSEKQQDDISKACGIPSGESSSTSTIKALLVVASAAMFHASLEELLPSMKPDIDTRSGEKFSHAWPPKSLQECYEDNDPIKSLEESWNLILATDYKPVFETAINVIKTPYSTHNLTEAVRDIIKTVMLINCGYLSRKHDILGRIFHRALNTAKNDGSYYTSTAAATLLAGCAIPPYLRKGKKIQDLRIVDPACGTGTLLMAVAERLQDIDGAPGHSDLLCKALIEDVIHGYDINLTATHMAATTLGLLAPEVKFNDMNIHKFVFGVEDSMPKIGALELYDGKYCLTEWASADRQKRAEIDITHELYDIVIMNPPFTRDGLRYDQFTKQEKAQMKAREKQVFDNTPAHRSNTGGMFMLLADKLADQTDGCVAVILAGSSAGSPSSKGVWDEIFKTFYVETVIDSHDPEKICFSENTTISEIMLVLRRLVRDDPDWEPPDAKYIRLSINPKKPSEAIPIYNDYHDGKIKENPNVSLCEWSQQKFKENNWLPSKFFSNYLLEMIEEMFFEDGISTQPLGDMSTLGPNGREIRGCFDKCLVRGNEDIRDTLSNTPILTKPLAYISDIGPAGQGVRGCFNKVQHPDVNGYEALWNNDTLVTNQMLLQRPDTYITAKPGLQTRAEALWNKRGRLLIPTRFSTPSMLLGAVWSEKPILGSGWIPVKRRTGAGATISEDVKAWEKAICVWLNSTLGILAQLSCSTPKTLTYPQMSLDGQKRIPTPDLTFDQTLHLASVFDEVCNEKLERWSEPNSTPRVTLDHAIAETLGISKEQLDKARREFAKEPSVTNKRYAVATP